MGIIQRQGVKYAIANYIGVAIGMLSTFFLYGYDKETYGLFRFLTDTANLLMPFATLGVGYAGPFFFPYFQDEAKKNNGYLIFLLLQTIIGCLITLPFFWLFRDNIIALLNKNNNQFFTEYLYVIPILIVVFAMTNIFRVYAVNLQRITVFGILDQLIKITFPILFFFFIKHFISIKTLLDGVIINYIVVLILLLFYFKWQKKLYLQPNFDFLTKDLMKQVLPYMTFGILASVGPALALRLDTTVVGLLGGAKSTGKYGIESLIASVISIPISAIGAASAATISRAWRNNDREELKMVYKKSSITLLIIGFYLFIGINACIQDMFKIMPKSEEMQGNNEALIVFCISLAKLFDMATGINDYITAYSDKYKQYLILLFGLITLNLSLMYLLIPIMDNVALAVALSTMISSIAFNLTKYIYIKKQFQLSPFTPQTWRLVAIGAGVYILSLLMPSTGNHFFNILYKGTIITFLFFGLVLYFNISENVTSLFSFAWKKIKKR